MTNVSCTHVEKSTSTRSFSEISLVGCEVGVGLVVDVGGGRVTVGGMGVGRTEVSVAFGAIAVDIPHAASKREIVVM